MGEREMAAEQRHVDRVYLRLEQVREDAVAIATDGHRRAHIGNEGALYERDVMVYESARRLRTLDAEYEGLVFGRLDLVDGEARHIGRLGVRDADYEPLVVDWRAPAAAAFYRATTEDPMDVVRRRVIHSAGTRVVGVSDDLLDPAAAPEAMPVVGEGALMAALARARGHTMRDIVATIQREQDEAVRAPASGVTLIEGGPGTGKTAVALHRAAYLLYQNRRRFTGGGVLLVGPSRAFMTYIERVLPSLGEDSVVLRALGELVEDVRATRRDSPAVAAVKGSLRMRRVLARAVKDAAPTAPTSLRIVYGGEVLRLEGHRLAAVRRVVHHRGAAPNASRARAVEALVAALWDTAMEWSDPPLHWDRERFDEEVRERNEFTTFVRAWWPVLTPAEVFGWLADRERLARYAGGVLSPAEIAVLAGSFVVEEPSVADAALLDELRALLGRPPQPPSRRRVPDPGEMQELRLSSDRPVRGVRPESDEEYALIVVDEAQDLSPMQWRMLGRRGRHASWTIVGDPAQSAWESPVEASQARDAAVGTARRRQFTLTTNYRNSAEIFDLAARVLRRDLPDAELPRAVRPTGHPPAHHVVPGGDLADAVRDEIEALLDAVEGTVGIVTPAALRAQASTWVPRGRADADRAQVVDAIEAKGLEYDAVVVVDPAAIAAESSAGVRVLYVALSRATHRLTTISTDPAWLDALGLDPRHEATEHVTLA
ncbi:MAG TPA: UvrD-helicase domain-containing protein [Cryptosporangiaceae bacterium]|nr:UvrD-helicase domain-containing protein [Cryptosporangiaceae bacterium]